VLFPIETNGTELDEKKEMEMDNGKRVIMTYKGDQNFTLIQEKNETVPTAKMEDTTEEMQGEVVNLGHSIGALSGNSIEWNYEGTDFLLASDNMTEEEMIHVAESIQGKEI